MAYMTMYHDSMLPIDLDIDMLRCFLEVTRTGSFTKTGKNIGLTQSGVSVKIRRLEERLDTQIFNRLSKNLSLTHEGEILLNHAGRILAAHDEAVSQLTKPKAAGKLRVGIIDYFSPELLPNILSKFKRQFPNIHLEVWIDVGMNLISLFEKGELDIVVAGKESYQGNVQLLTQEPLLWVVSKDSDPSQYESLPLVLFPFPCSFRQIATKSLKNINRDWETPFTGTSTASIQNAVKAGMGVAILPQGAVITGIKKVPPSLGLPELPMHTIVVIVDESKENDARDVFISYLEVEVNSLE